MVSISHPERLAFELHSQDMISAQVRDETLKIMGPSTRCRASKLIAAVKDQITMNPSALYKFLSVVRGDPSLVYIADAMSDHYSKYHIAGILASFLIWQIGEFAENRRI